MDKTTHLETITFKNFKKFKSLELKNLGQFNLIVGDNNVGKTSLLEGLLFSENKIEFFKNIHRTLCEREIHLHGTYTENYLKYFFKEDQTLKIKYKFKTSKFKTIQVEVKRYDNLTEIEKKKIYSKQGVPNPIPRYWTKFSNNEKGFEYDFLYADEHSFLHERYIPFIPFQQKYGKDLVGYYSSLARESKSLKKDLIDDLRIFIPEIEDIELLDIVNGHTYLSIREKNEEEAFPVSRYGDGAVKLLRILLELGKSKNGRLMIDEIDTGVHHYRFKEFWITVINAAIKHNVQLFATTHNLEGLKYFNEAFESEQLSKMAIEATHIRLKSNTENEVKAFIYKFEEFQFALKQGNDLR